MLIKLPLCAAVLALCACSSPPKVQYPSGNGPRTPVNGTIRPSESPYWDAAKPPAPMAAKRFYVEPGAMSVMAVMAQWAHLGHLKLDWGSGTDYPVTERIREIREGTLDAALERTNAALIGVERPLKFSVKEGRLVVRDLGKPSAPVPSPAPAAQALARPVEAAPQVPGRFEVRVDTLFGFGSTQLSPAGRKAVAGIADQLREVASQGFVIVVGHADRIGADTANVTVSFQRASNVRNELKRYLPQAQIFAEGRGSKEPIVDCPGIRSASVLDCLAPNRRVTVQGVRA